MNRREMLTGSVAVLGAGSLRPAAAATPLSTLGLDAAQLGVRPGSPDDQSRALQRAIHQAAERRMPLALGPGVYHAGELTLPPGAQITGVRGATRIVLRSGRALFSTDHADGVTLSGLVLDGAGRALPPDSGLVSLANGRSLRIVDCEIRAAGGHAIRLRAMAGELSGNTIVQTNGVAILSFEARGLTIARNTITGAAENGVQILRQQNGDDGTLVIDNRIEDIDNRPGGTGQYGNGVNAHRAANVIVRGNRIRNCIFSAVRGNNASNIQIIGNSCSDLGEVALYSEFGFEGAVIAHNIVEVAGVGVSISNFNEGGRLAVVQGNVIRGIRPQRRVPGYPEETLGVGIYVEADTAVTGNVVEKASLAGLMLGWGRYLRDVTATGNVVRSADIGIAVSVVPGAGSALISNNLISGSTRGAIVGVDHHRPVTGDLTGDGAARYAQLTISGNRVP